MDQKPAAIETATGSARSKRRATILIVEDSPVQAELLRRALEGASYKVIAASNGAEGLAMAQAHHPVAVVSDINMPVMDGYALCHAIRHDDELKTTPVILLTMLSDPLDVIRGLNAGADAYVTKPYNVPTLVSRIESLLAYPPVPPPPVERRKVEVRLAGETHLVDAHGPRMLNLLVSTYENAVLQNRELAATQQALEDLNQHLEKKVLEKTAVLRDSERRFRALIEHASDLVTVVDAQGKIAYISPAVKRLGGYEVDEVLGTLYLDYAHPEDRSAATASLAELLRNPGKLQVSEFRFRAKDGAWVALESIAQNALDDPAINGIVINSRDITERKLAQSELEFKNSVLLTQQETSLDAMLLVDENRNILSYNQRFVDLWSLPEDMLKAGLNEPILKSVVSQTEDPDAYLAQVLHLYEHPEEKSREEVRLKDGRTIDRYSASVIGAGGKCFGRVWYYRDITERKRAEEKIVRLNRLYATLSGINTAIVHAASPAELFDRVCEVAVNHGHFCMAWIGTVDRAGQMVTPVAHRGLTPEDMAAIRDSNGRVEEGRGRTATSIRESRPIVTNDYDAERSLTPWHTEAVKHGVRGSATLPIKQRGEIVGVLKLYVRERDFFDPEQLALLKEMGTDISFALDHFDTEAKRTQAETALLESEVRFRALIENASDITAVVSQDGVISYTSPSIKTIAGYDLDELVDSNMAQVIHPDDVQAATGTLSESIRVPEEAHRVELRIRMKDGSWRVFDVLVRNQLGQAAIGGVIVNMRDVTERKRGEEMLRKSAAGLKEAQRVASLGNWDLDPATGKLAWSEELSRIFGRDPVLPAPNYEELARIFAPESYARMNAAIDKTRKTGEPYELDLELVHPDGTRKWITARGEAKRDSNGQIIGLLGTALDITERKRAEADRKQYAERLGRSLEQSILAVAAIVEMRDPYTAGHQRRVAELAVVIAKELGLPEEQIHGLHLAGIIHDLGKIQVPAEILSKPGKLTELEFSLIKIHPQAGYDILKDVEFPWPIAQIVLQHHERLDGSGYPQGLKAEQILLEAGILAVADVIEAMSSHRPYRPGLGIDKALSEIERGRGIAYDPTVVDACVKLFREKRFSWA